MTHHFKDREPFYAVPGGTGSAGVPTGAIVEEYYPAAAPENVVPLRSPEPVPFQPTEPSIAQLLAMCEEMDRGMKLMVGVIAEQDKRIRHLELQERKAARRNVPVIVNQMGQPVSAK